MRLVEVIYRNDAEDRPYNREPWTFTDWCYETNTARHYYLCPQHLPDHIKFARSQKLKCEYVEIDTQTPKLINLAERINSRIVSWVVSRTWWKKTEREVLYGERYWSGLSKDSKCDFFERLKRACKDYGLVINIENNGPRKAGHLVVKFPNDDKCILVKIKGWMSLEEAYKYWAELKTNNLRGENGHQG